MAQKFFVCGITGAQGGSVAKHLLPKGVEIHALARTPSSPAAQEFAALGAKITPGAYEDKDALAAAMQGCTGVYLNLCIDFADDTTELRQAKAIIDAARAAGTVAHIVHASTLGPDGTDKLRWWDKDSPLAKMLLSKRAIEKEVMGAGFKHWTINRVACYMANFFDPFFYPGLIENGSCPTSYERETKLAFVDTETIGAFGAAALMDPERFHRQDVTVMDCLPVFDEMLDDLGKATGRKFEAVYLSPDEVEAQWRVNPIFGAGLVMRDVLQFVDDWERIKSWGVPLSSFANFLERERDRVDATFNANK